MLICIYTRKIRHNCEKSNLKFQVTVKKNLVLLGMMAVGKTTLAKIVAKNQNMQFIDIDKNIEKKNSMKIREIFEYLKENLDQDVTKVNLVISGNKTVLVKSGDELIDILQKGQGVLNILPLATVKEEVDSAIVQLRPLSETNVEPSEMQIETGS